MEGSKSTNWSDEIPDNKPSRSNRPIRNRKNTVERLHINCPILTYSLRPSNDTDPTVKRQWNQAPLTLFHAYTNAHKNNVPIHFILLRGDHNSSTYDPSTGVLTRGDEKYDTWLITPPK